MKDIHITVKQQKREIAFILASFLSAVCCNVYAIVSYGTELKEIYTQWFAVLALTAVFYLLSVFFRFLYRLIFSRKKAV